MRTQGGPGLRHREAGGGLPPGARRIPARSVDRRRRRTRRGPRCGWPERESTPQATSRVCGAHVRHEGQLWVAGCAAFPARSTRMRSCVHAATVRASVGERGVGCALMSESGVGVPQGKAQEGVRAEGVRRLARRRLQGRRLRGGPEGRSADDGLGALQSARRRRPRGVHGRARLTKAKAATRPSARAEVGDGRLIQAGSDWVADARGKLKAGVEPDVFLVLVRREVDVSRQYVAAATKLRVRGCE